ncbi:MAG TPA: MmcQ/YjbR family DNA-binding protein [Gaiellaceae bacterium]|nr:MmcQ/YjbR family DNA-binding protein [Gaiellaceae bacterium]
MPTWEDVRRIALALPDAEETTTHGQPCFRVNGRPFVNTGRVQDAIVTRAPDEERDLLTSALPDVYFVTDHYLGWEAVLVRLDAVDEDELAGRIEDSYAFIAAKPPARPRKR